MKFRVKYINGIGFWAQVKPTFFSPWYRIGEHVTGFGLYPEKSLDYPVSSAQKAMRLIEAYIQWENKKTEWGLFLTLSV